MSEVEPIPMCPVCGSLDFDYAPQSEGWHCEACDHFEDETPEGMP